MHSKLIMIKASDGLFTCLKLGLRAIQHDKILIRLRNSDSSLGAALDHEVPEPYTRRELEIVDGVTEQLKGLRIRLSVEGLLRTPRGS